MTLKECYSNIKGNYEDAAGRLLKEDRIVKYLKKFAESRDFDEYVEASESEDWERAFRSVHNIKGMALNLSITGVADISSRLCELVRNGKPQEDASVLEEELKTELNRVVKVIESLE